MSKVTVRQTILDGNLGDGWTDNYRAARAYANVLASEYRAEFGVDADIEITVQRNAGGYIAPADIWSDDGDDAGLRERAAEISQYAWEQFARRAPDNADEGTVTVGNWLGPIEVALNLMDNELLEAMNDRGAVGQELVDRYAAAHLAKFGEEFTVN